MVIYFSIIYTMEQYNLRLFFLFTTSNLIPLQFLFHITTSILITVDKSCFVILISHRKNSFTWFYHPTYMWDGCYPVTNDTVFDTNTVLIKKKTMQKSLQ